MLKRFLSLILVAALLVMSAAVSIPALADEALYATEFYAGFEDGDETTSSLLENKVYEVNGVPQAQGMGEIVQQSAGLAVTGDFTSKVSSVTAPAASYSGYVAENLLDANTGTLYSTTPTVPFDIIYTLSQPAVLGEYALGTYYAAWYGPNAWTVYGSNDGETWAELHAVSNPSLTGTDNFKVTNQTAYSQYKLTITGVSSTWYCYLTDWILGTGVEEGGGDETPKVNALENSVYGGLTPVGNNSSNYSDAPISGNWNGSKALKVEGVDVGADRSYAKMVLFEDVNVKIEENTQFEYAVDPAYGSWSNFDFEWTSQYIALDLLFTDGTLLSELGAVDQYENSLAASAQGEGGYLYSIQWNVVRSKIGQLAAGKVVDKILVVFDKPQKEAQEDKRVLAYFDEIKIRPVEEKVRESVVEYADIRVGSNDKPLWSRGLQWPSVMTPNGFNYWVPSTNAVHNNASWNATNIYDYYPGNNGITHFTVSHEASAWIGDFGTFQFMANTSADPTTTNPNATQRQSKFNRDNEIANPHYYSVIFNEGTPASGVQVEITPTEHAAMARITYPKDSANANVIFDSVMSSNGGYITFSEDNKSFSAKTTHVSGEGGSRHMYIYGEFDKAPEVVNVTNSDATDAIVGFAEGTTEVNIKMATSFISEDQAKKNLALEIAADATFEDVKASATKAWEDILGVVEIEGATEEQMIEMYTYLYHTYSAPMLLSENTGTAEEPVWSYASPYGGSTSQPEIITGYKFYYNNGFWDTFRGSWSTYALLTPSYDTDLLNGLVQHGIDNTWIPRWVSPGGRNSMVGTSSDIILGDAMAKGIQFDWQAAYEVSKKNGTTYSSNAINGGRTGMDTSIFTGYTDAAIDGGKGMSWAMDNYLNDYGIAQMADILGYEDDAEYFRNRAQNYVNLFNPGSGGWFVGKRTNGAWSQNVESSSWNPANKSYADYEETNPWTMAFTVTQDYQGLVNLYGGKDNLVAKLDEFFTTDYLMAQRDYVLDFLDTKIGLYGHSNQPSHHITYVYNYAGQPYKTQALTREILDRVYVGTSNGQGFPGDADNGEMAGWYVMSALGLCPITTGTEGYAITSPLHDKTVLHLESGDLTIIAENNSKENVYIQSMTIDGVPYNKCYITYEDLTNASEIVYVMGPEPSDWATAEDSVPPSITEYNNSEVANPYSDFTKSGVEAVDAIPETTGTTEAAYAADGTAIAELFNNTSSGTVTFNTAETSVYYYFPTAKQVKMLTLSSGSSAATAPKAAAVYGANDPNGEWTQVAAIEDIAFDWAQETAAFSVDTAGKAYKYYRIDLSGAENLALSEIELLGTRTAILDCSDAAKSDDGTYSAEVTTDYDITGLNFRLADGTIIEPISADETENADGTTTTAVVFAVDEDVDKIYAYAKNENGYEITQSRKTIALKDTEVIADIVSVTTDADAYKVNDAVTFTVVTSANVNKLALANEYGKYIAKLSESYVDNGDGTLTWTVTASFATKGDREISIYYATADQALTNSGVTAAFSVDIAVSASDDAVSVISVRAPEAAAVNDVFALTVNTSTSVTKVGIFDSVTGKALGKVSQSYVDKEGERIWTIMIKVGSKGNRTFDVKATDKSGVWSQAKSFDITIYK